MIEILILSLLQGITEFIPVSSSSHLIIFSEFFDFENKNLSIDVSLHIGSFIAVVTFFYKDIKNFVKNKDLFLKIFISSLPVMVVGYMLVKTNLIDQLRNIELIGWTTLIFGILLFFSDKFEMKKNLEDNFTIKSAFIIGFFQILSLVPGVSRSGITITAARILKFNRFDSVKISFLLSIPTLAMISVYGFYNIINSDNINISKINLIAIFLSYIFSFITIKYFIRFIKTFSLNLFVYYRVILGILILVLSAIK